jgi:hypothetical protein
MSGKRKPSPESSLTSLSPNSLLLSSPSAYPFYGDEDKNASKDNGGVSFMKLNQQKNKELTKSAKILQIPQKQKVLLSTRSKTFDSIPPTSEVNNNAFPSSSSSLYDYDSVHSPGGASNASSEGPTYVRTPGFEHHGQEFEIQRKRQQYSKSRASFTSHVDEQLDCNDSDIASRHENIRSSSKVSHNGAVSNVTTKKKKSLVVGTSSSKHEAETTKKTDSSQQPTSKHKSKKGMFYQLNLIL